MATAIKDLESEIRTEEGAAAAWSGHWQERSDEASAYAEDLEEIRDFLKRYDANRQ